MIYVDAGGPGFGQGAFGAAPPLTPEQQAKKWCADYGVPPAQCAGLIECAKERGWEQCAVAIGAAVAAGACAAYLTPAMAPVCGAVAQWFLELIGTEGMITRSCFIPEVRLLTTDDIGSTPSRWLDRTLDVLNVGEFVIKTPTRLVVMPMYKINCGDALPEDLVFDVARLPSFYDRLDLVWAAKDWDGTRYKVEGGQLVRETPTPTQYLFTPYQVKYVPAAIAPGGYAAGSFAIYDSAVSKYRILAPA